MHQELEAEDKGQGGAGIWLEFVSDLWDQHLPHLREELYGEGLFVYNPNTGCYGFQEEEEEEDVSSGDELMTALLREAVEDEEGRGGGRDDSFRIQPSSMEDSFAVISEDTTGHSFDLNQPSSDEEGEEEEEKSALGINPESSALPEDCEYLWAVHEHCLISTLLMQWKRD